MGPQSRTVYLTSHSRPPTLPTAAWSYPSQACRALALAPKSKSGPLEILKIFPLSREKKNDSTSQGGRLHNLYSLFLCLLSTPPTEYLDPFPLFPFLVQNIRSREIIPKKKTTLCQENPFFPL